MLGLEWVVVNDKPSLVSVLDFFLSELRSEEESVLLSGQFPIRHDASLQYYFQ